MADDLTGACAVGALVCRHGGKATVWTAQAAHTHLYLTDGAVGIVDLAVRRATALEAQCKVQHWWELLHSIRQCPVGIRIDSTLRGQIGALVQAILRENDGSGVIVAPAFPESGRTTSGGRHFLYGQPIMQTEIAHDPWGPVQTDNICELLQNHLGETVALLPLELIRQGSVTIAAALNALEQRVVVIDAETNTDIETVAEAMSTRQRRPWIPVDAGPLSAAWARHMYGQSNGHLRMQDTAQPAKSDFRNTPPVLAVCGSLMDRARKQLEVLAELPGVQVVIVPAEELVRDARKIAGTIGGQWEPEHPVLAVATTPTRHTDPGAVAAGLADLTRELWSALPFVGCFLSGGDIAAAGLDALEAIGLDIDMEVLPLAVRSILVGGPFAQSMIVTKGGSVGDCNAMVRCITALQEP